MKNTQQNATIGAVIAVIVILGLAVYFTEQDTKIEPVAQKTDFKEVFMSGCLEAGSDLYAYCSCTYDKLEKDLGISGLIDVSIKYDETGELPKEVFPAMSSCANQL